MTCKDCIYSEICLEQYSKLNPDTMFNECKKFKNKADFVEVCRCSECKHCEHCYPCKAKEEEALEGWYCNIFRGWRSPDDYCSYGKQKPNLSTIPTGSEGRDT